MKASCSRASIVDRLGAVMAAAALLASVTASSRAHAFGGLWSPEGSTLRQTGQSVLLIDHPDQTLTLVAQLRYAGAAEDFAWVIPVPGTPQVAVSSNIVFERLAPATAPEYWVEIGVEGSCRDGAKPHSDAYPSGYDPAPDPLDPATPVIVVDRGAVGPYEYETIAIEPSADDPAAAAAAWLQTHGYHAGARAAELLGPYLDAGLNLLALRFREGAGDGALRPVMLTYESELPAIPLRLAAAAAQDDSPLQVWVVGPSQAVPQNYRSLVLNDALLDWSSGLRFVAGSLPGGGDGPISSFPSRPSNYDALVSAAADEAGGHGFVTELGAPTSQFRQRIWSALDAESFALLADDDYEDGLDAVLAAGEHYARWDGFREAVEGATTLPEGVTIDALLGDPEAYREEVEVDTTKLFELIETDVLAPLEAAAAALHDGPYLTRLFTTLSPDETSLDPVFDYNAELAQVSNVHVARQRLLCEPSQALDDAPWRIELPQGGVVLGAGRDAWPFELGSMPANLKVVELSSHGSGRVVADNSREIGQRLYELAGEAGSSLTAPHLLAQHGLLIGGTQSVLVPAIEDGASGDDPPPGGDARQEPEASSRAGGCSVAGKGGRDDAGRGAAWLFALALMLLASRRRRPGASVAALACALGLLAGCDGDSTAGLTGDGGAALAAGALTPEELRDPESCKSCHPIHFREWSSSMHAYAAQDPVFLAMNRRGQRETDGALGDFCIKCHAPMAAVDGLSHDGLDLLQLPDLERGVSCYFCHNVVGIEGDHNAMLRRADDAIMRGPIADPVPTPAHGAEHSELFEEGSFESSAMCGACHDIVTPDGVHLERTFLEYESGIFSKSADGEPPANDTCPGCHMPPARGQAAIAPGAGTRTIHEHLWPGIDVALTDFPHREAMERAVEDCQLGLSISFFTLEVTPPDLFTFQIQAAAGHNTPSGAAQDRRMWLELLAYDGAGELIEHLSSGDLADGEVEEKPAGDPDHDPHLLMFRDYIYDAKGEPVHMFWDAAKSEAYPDGYRSNTLQVATTTYVEGRHALVKQYRLAGPDGLPARVTARLRIRPIGMDVLEDLVESGDLDPAIAAAMPTFAFPQQIEWTPAKGVQTTIRPEPSPADCVTYRCLLDPGSAECR